MGPTSAEDSGAVEAAGQSYAVLLLEYISDRVAKVLIRLGYLATLASAALLIWESIEKFVGPTYMLTLRHSMDVINVVVACVGLTILLTLAAFFCGGIAQARREGKRWTARRRRLLLLTAVELFVQVVNLSFLLVPNAVLFTHPCGWFMHIVHWSGFAQWSCWNLLALLWMIQAHSLLPLAAESKGMWSWVLGKRWVQQAHKDDAMVIDLPISFHLPKVLLFWLPTQTGIFLFVLSSVGVIGPLTAGDFDAERCRYIEDNAYAHPVSDYLDRMCSKLESPTAVVFNILMVVGFMVMLVVYLILTFIARERLRELPYRKFRVANIELRVQFRTKLVAICSSIVSLAVLWYAKLHYCDSYTLTWLGLTPLYLSVTMLVAINAILYCPILPTQQQVDLHDWLQDFAWAESEVEQKLASRHVADPALFCYETAIKTMYWSRMMYRFDQEGEQEFTLERAMGAFELTRYHLLWDKKSDMKCCLAWDVGARTVVIAFRGTASKANAIHDLKAWRSVHPPARGSYLLGTQPLVHAGFLQSWQGGGLNVKAMEKLREVLTSTEGGSGSDSVAINVGAATGAAGTGTDTGSDSDLGNDSGSSSAAGAAGLGPAGSLEQVCGRSWWFSGKGCGGSAGSVPGLWQSSGSVAADTFPGAIRSSPTSSPSQLQQTVGEEARASSGITPWRVICTGHSLGGALAMLAAYDSAQLVAELGGDSVAKVSCFTFGAPRPGNSAFARDYIQKVANSWDVFHTNDAVAVEGKLFFMFKRAAHRVILTPTKDIIVRPSHLEATMQRGPRISVAAHLLKNYGASLGAIISTQCRKGLLGMEQLAALSQVEPLLETISGMGLASISKAAKASGHSSTGSHVTVPSKQGHRGEGWLGGEDEEEEVGSEAQEGDVPIDTATDSHRVC